MQLIKLIVNFKMNNRLDLINYFILSRHYTKYLEIGVFKGNVLNNVICEEKIGIDPKPLCESEYIIKTTSDKFFEHLDVDDKFDIIFIDGDHSYDQVIKDISNSLKHLSANGMILLHDCISFNETMTIFRENRVYTGGVCYAFIQMAMLNEIDKKFNIYFTGVDGIGIIDFADDSVKTYKHEDMLNKYIDLIENRMKNFYPEGSINRNDKELLKYLISTFTISWNEYKPNIKWLYPICKVAELEGYEPKGTIIYNIIDLTKELETWY